MRVIPKGKVEQLEFCASHLAKWAQNAEAIGVAPEDVAELAALTEAARAKFAAQQRAIDVARAATAEFDLARAAMTTLAAAIVKQVRAKAGVAGDGVYPLASLPVPEKGSPLAAPGTPFGFTTLLHQGGAVELSWKCKNPRNARGTIYEIYRSDDGPGGVYNYIGNTGVKKFVDARIPAGAACVTYMLRAVRSTKVGQAVTFNVHFGGDAPQVGGPVVPHAPRLAA